MDYQRKIDFAIKLLRSIPQDGPIELSYSGGKDSDVILELAKMAGIPFEAIYKNTTIDPPGTIAHARAVGATIVQPSKTMFQVIEQKGWPSRFNRFCCAELKEYSIHRRAIQGIRRSESTKRAARYKEPEICRTYKAGDNVRIYYPILEWTEEDVARFVEERGIKCHQLYYDAQGKFHPERRLGCIGCPLASGNGRKEFEKYPKMLRAWIKAEQAHLISHPNSKSADKFENNAYNVAYFVIFCKNMEQYRAAVKPPLFPELGIDTKQYLENYFHIDLTL